MVLSDDLMFSQMVANALPDDCSIRPASSQAAAESSLDEKVKAMIVDLSLRVDPGQLVATAKGAGIRVIGIASHVHVAKIQAARTAGFDEVLTRSQVADHLRRVITG
jgi:hypothetical protein